MKAGWTVFIKVRSGPDLNFVSLSIHPIFALSRRGANLSRSQIKGDMSDRGVIGLLSGAKVRRRDEVRSAEEEEAVTDGKYQNGCKLRYYIKSVQNLVSWRAFCCLHGRLPSVAVSQLSLKLVSDFESST